MDPTARPTFIAIARIVRTRGNKGEVLAELHTDFPARFNLLKRVWVAYPDGHRERLTLENCWEHKGRQILKFEATDSIGAAEAMIGAWVEVEPCEAVALPEGSYWDHELTGCRLRNTQGDQIGVVTGVLRIAGNDQLVVEGPGGEFLVPMVASICRDVDIERREILVELPEGLMDLNR